MFLLAFLCCAKGKIRRFKRRFIYMRAICFLCKYIAFFKMMYDKTKYNKISELFDIYTGGDLILSETDEGEYPVASNSSDNNNIAFYSCFIPQRKLFNHTYSISIADRGAFKAFVQPKDFYIGTRAKGLESKNKDISILSLLFIATVINQQSFRFSYGYNCCAHLNDMIIKLPVKTDDSLDYSFMENYMKSLPYGDRI